MGSELTPREFHALREAKRLQEREKLRVARLEAIQQAVRRHAPDFPAIQAVYLFGSILKTGRHTAASDIDVAVQGAGVAEESDFWRTLEQAVQWNVDVRPYAPPLIEEIAISGIKVYERAGADSRA
jgi:predicted nucleotidyltransferase